MPIRAVITLTDTWCRGIEDSLRLDPRVVVDECGDGNRLQITLDVDDAESADAFWERLRLLDGVLSIDFAHAVSPT